MPDFRRASVPGGTYFFTVVTHQRAPILCQPIAIELLRGLLRQCGARWPLQIDAIVILPDHLHAIWTLPPMDSSYSVRWGWLKKEFTEAWLGAGKREQPQSGGRDRDGRRGVWQSKFWEHAVRDQHDYARHMDYVHYNPVKHGYATCPHLWPWSSFSRCVQRGWYPADWACGCGESKPRELDFSDIRRSTGE
jgi:putative transposase